MSETSVFTELYMRMPPHEHQLEEFDKYRDSFSRATIWAPRNGKTKSTIDLSFYLFHKKKIKTVIIFAPSGVNYNWIARELPTHAWTGIDHVAHYWRSSEKQIHIDMCRDLAVRKPLILAFNHEALLLDRVLELVKNALKRGPALLVVDESHCYRTPGSARTKRMRALAKHFTYKRILTGTLVSNSPLAAYSQFEILEQGALGFKTFGEFKHRYSETAFRPGGRPGQETVVGYRNLDELNAKIARWSTVVGRGTMSIFTHVVKDFEMSKPQKAMYDSLKKEFFLETEDGKKISTAEGGARLLKLQQVLSGFIIDEDRVVRELVPPDKNPRLLALRETLDELDGKVIIWAKFKHELKMIADMIGDEGVEFHGDIKSQDRQLAIDKFMKDDKCKYFIGQPQAGGTGINLSIAKNVLWFSHTFDSIDRIQATERATAINGHGVTVTDICCPGSLDTYILSKLKDKKSISAEVITTKDL